MRVKQGNALALLTHIATSSCCTKHVCVFLFMECASDYIVMIVTDASRSHETMNERNANLLY